MNALVRPRPKATQELVGYWPLNDSPWDYSGNGNHGTAAATSGASVPARANGQIDGAFGFNGSTHLVTLAKPFAKGQSSVTLVAGLKLNSIPVTNPFGIIFEPTPDSGGLTRLGLLIRPSGKAACGGRGAANDPAGNFYGRDTDTVLATGRWYRFVGVWNVGIADVQLYLNGVKETGTVVGTGAVEAFASTAPNWGPAIGSAGATATATTHLMDGSIDDVRVYNRVLDPWEVIADHKAWMQGRP